MIKSLSHKLNWLLKTDDTVMMYLGLDFVMKNIKKPMVYVMGALVAVEITVGDYYCT